MNAARVEKIANAVLYEGYLLYPYRASAIKNQQRFNFGVLYPRECSEGSDAWEMRTECLLEGTDDAAVEVKTRFLQLVARESRQEGIPREVSMPLRRLGALETPIRQRIGFEGIEGDLDLRAERVGEGLWRIALRIRNRAVEGTGGRDEALLHSMISVHSIFEVKDGRFVSVLDPPEKFRNAAGECRNIGCWPVLVGEEGQSDMMLASPIILYDYPQIAPESPGDLFDGTEIDEILALRILTLSDAEKEEVRGGDERARRILERTEMLPAEHFQKLHGAMRGREAR
jgi:hypothetical protein